MCVRGRVQFRFTLWEILFELNLVRLLEAALFFDDYINFFFKHFVLLAMRQRLHVLHLLNTIITCPYYFYLFNLIYYALRYHSARYVH